MQTGSGEMLLAVSHMNLLFWHAVKKNTQKGSVSSG